MNRDRQAAENHTAGAGRGVERALRVGPFSDPNRYVLVNHEALGSEGRVFRGRDTKKPQRGDLAVKVAEGPSDGTVPHALARRLELLSRLKHPHLCVTEEAFVGPRMHDASDWPWYRYARLSVLHGRTRGVPRSEWTLYEVSRWVTGNSLQHLAASQTFDAPTVFRLLGQVGAALDMLHEEDDPSGRTPVIHGDVSPANIMVSQDHNAVLIDLGLARPSESVPGERALHPGATVVPAGTPGFVAPERLSGAPPSPASDRYALGAVAYFLLTGKVPSQAAELEQVSAELEASGHQPLYASRIVEMLNPDPDGRPVSAAKWAQGERGLTVVSYSPAYSGLEPAPDIQDGGGTPSPRPLAMWRRVARAVRSTAGTSRQDSKRRRIWLALLATLVVALITTVALFATDSPTGNESATENGNPTDHDSHETNEALQAICETEVKRETMSYAGVTYPTYKWFKCDQTSTSMVYTLYKEPTKNASTPIYLYHRRFYYFSGFLQEQWAAGPSIWSEWKNGQWSNNLNERGRRLLGYGSLDPWTSSIGVRTWLKKGGRDNDNHRLQSWRQLVDADLRGAGYRQVLSVFYVPDPALS